MLSSHDMYDMNMICIEIEIEFVLIFVIKFCMLYVFNLVIWFTYILSLDYRIRYV